MIQSFFSRPVNRNGVTHVHLIRPWDELLEAGCDWDDLRAFLLQVCDVLWLSDEETYVYYVPSVELDPLCRTPLQFSDDDGFPVNFHRFQFTCGYKTSDGELRSDGEGVLCLCTTAADHEPTQAYLQLFQLSAQKPAEYLSLKPGYGEDEGDGEFEDEWLVRFPTSAETLKSLLDIVQVHKEVSLNHFFFSQQHCDRLASFRGHLAFYLCEFEDDGRAIFERIGSNRGLTGLSVVDVEIDVPSFESALSNTSSLEYLRAAFVPFPELLASIRQNESLISLDLGREQVTDETWVNFFESIRRHPTLKKFAFDGMIIPSTNSNTDRVRRANVILGMLSDNKTLLEIRGDKLDRQVDPQILENQIRLCLKANLYRPRIKALLEERDDQLQRRLFSAALLHPELNRTPALMYLLVSSFRSQLSEWHEQDAAESVSATRRGCKRRRVRR